MSATIAVNRRETFWRQHLVLPLCCFVPLATLLAFTDLDRRLAHAWAFDSTSGAFPARHAYWAERVLHGYGHGFVWSIVVGCALLLAASAFRPALRHTRRATLYVILAIGVSTALIGGLKQLTQVHCPWDLQEFGGSAHYALLFAPREAQAAPGACFPGAHSGSGFALLALYFWLLHLRPRRAKWGLLLGLLTGCSFAFAQEARGAHFLSHDLWSAMLAWCVCLTLYVAVLAPASVRRAVPRSAAAAHSVPR